jgi:putative salt-induced outer membrane protein YdiY
MTLRALVLASALAVVSAGAWADEPTPIEAELERLPPVPEEVVTPLGLPSAAPSVVDDLAAEEDGRPEEKFWLWTPGWQVWQPTFWDPWEGNVELGLNGTDGNSETFNVRFGVTAKYKTESLWRSVQLTSIQKRANGKTTANTALLDGRLEWPMPGSRWNYFMHGLLEYDEFKAFNTRLSADTGFGYEFLQNEQTTLMGRSGLAVSREISGPDNAVHPELLLGGEYKHRFNEFHSISGKTEFYPSVLDFGDFRLNSQASWEMALSKIWGLSLKLSIIDRYDSTPQGARPNDLDYSTLLIWSF